MDLEPKGFHSGAWITQKISARSHSIFVSLTKAMFTGDPFQDLLIFTAWVETRSRPLDHLVDEAHAPGARPTSRRRRLRNDLHLEAAPVFPFGGR